MGGMNSSGQTIYGPASQQGLLDYLKQGASGNSLASSFGGTSGTAWDKYGPTYSLSENPTKVDTPVTGTGVGTAYGTQPYQTSYGPIPVEAASAGTGNANNNSNYLGNDVRWNDADLASPETDWAKWMRQTQGDLSNNPYWQMGRFDSAGNFIGPMKFDNGQYAYNPNFAYTEPSKNGVAQASPYTYQNWLNQTGYSPGTGNAQRLNDWNSYFNNTAPGSTIDWAGGKLTMGANGQATYTPASGNPYTFNQNTLMSQVAAQNPAISNLWKSTYGY